MQSKFLEGIVMTVELKVLENVQKLTWNFEDVKQRLTDDIKKYADLIVSETNLLDMEKTQKEIASLRIRLQKFKLAVKKDFEKPYEAFELQVKELASLIESAEKPIKDQIQKYEDDRREAKRIQCEKMICEISAELGLLEKYSSQIVVADKYLNRTQKVKDTKEDIQQKVCWFLDIQAKEIADEAARTEKISMAKMMCEFMSKELATPLTFEDVENKINSFNITELRTYIENQVTTRKEREERAAQLALEREEQKRIAELARQEREEQARKEQLKRKEETAEQMKNIGYDISPDNVVIVDTVKKEPALPKFNAQFIAVSYGITEVQITEIKDFLESKNLQVVKVNVKDA
jgi:hypothetical protein